MGDNLIQPTLSHTTGMLTTVLIAVRCAHRPCLGSGRGQMLLELSLDHELVGVTALRRREVGYSLVTKCDHCGGWNGASFRLKQKAA